MLLYMRIVFGLNAIYQTALGLLCLLGPAVAIGVYGGSHAEQEMSTLQIVVRLLGVHLVPVGVISALLAGNPNGYPVLRAIIGIFAVLTMACWGIVFGVYHLGVGQIFSMVSNSVLQVALIGAVVFYMPRSTAASASSKRRAAA